MVSSTGPVGQLRHGQLAHPLALWLAPVKMQEHELVKNAVFLSSVTRYESKACFHAVWLRPISFSTLWVTLAVHII